MVPAGTAALLYFFGQAFLVDLGVEKNIAWSDIISAAFAAGAGVKGGLMSGIKIGGNTVIQAAMRAGIVNVTSQFAELAAGDISAFDLKQILASMIGAGLGQKVIPKLDDAFRWGQSGDNAASVVMDGFIDGAIRGPAYFNPEDMALQFLQSEAESMLDTGRSAISQASAQDAKTKPTTGKIPAPADTGTDWKNAGRNTEKKAAANDARWRQVGAKATHQKTEAMSFMHNQIQQAAAKSSDTAFGDSLYNAYAASVASYDNFNLASDLSTGNSNNSSWQNTARASASVNTSSGFLENAWLFSSRAAYSFGRNTVMGVWDTVTHPERLLHTVESGMTQLENMSGANGIDGILAGIIQSDMRQTAAIDSVKSFAGGIKQDWNSSDWSSLGTAAGLFAAQVNPFGGEFRDIKLAEDLAEIGRVEGGLSGLGDVGESVARRAYLNSKFGRIGNLDADINYRGYMELTKSLNVTTDPDMAVFYSGNGGLNRMQARIFAQNSGRKTIETTYGGQWLNQEKIYLRTSAEKADEVWSALSERYAYGAKGDVYAFAKNADPLRTYLRVERDILTSKSNVTLFELNELPDEYTEQYQLYLKNLGK
jgi:hypothetical protein